MPELDSSQKLKKELGLFDVFSVSTGAMFSSGFFLLPGLAAAKTGPAVILAYFLAGILILPAMFSKAELSTALPRAGGTYFFLDRSMGPMVGTIGGLGTYLSLTLKTAFALIGIGAYASFFIELPIKPVAIVLTGVFVVINIFGAKETTRLQRLLVTILLVVLALFIGQGFFYLLVEQPIAETKARFTPFMAKGFEGLFATVGFVFVSYAGLTKVASIAEEVKNPDRNIPLGMILSLAVTSLIYVLGVFILVAVMDAAVLKADLAPVATAAVMVFDWMPGSLGLILIVAAALAAFCSTGNAGLMSASRYPLAMARDHLLPSFFARLGKFNTPVLAILTTGGLMVFFIIVLDAEGIAKLASAFQLFIFMLVNFSVIVMRESYILSYDPGYRSPLYPWMQVFGIVTSLLLIVYMGWLAILFTVGIIVVCLAWYFHYARPHVVRDGAIYHWFHRLGHRQFEGLDREFRSILKEKGLRAEDPFDEIIARSMVIDLKDETSMEEAVALASRKLSQRLPKTEQEITERFLLGTVLGDTPVTRGVALPHFRSPEIDQAEMVLMRSTHSIPFRVIDPTDPDTVNGSEEVHAVFFLVSPERDPAQHLRILAQVAGRVDEHSFPTEWRSAKDEQSLREVLLNDERFLTIRVLEGTGPAALVEKRLREAPLPEGCLVALIRRDAQVIVPTGNTLIRLGDHLTVIGQAESIRVLHGEYDWSG